MKIVNCTDKLKQALVRAGATLGEEVYVKTCQSDNCGCVSHESGFDDLTIASPPSQTVLAISFPGDERTHPVTALLTPKTARQALDTETGATLRVLGPEVDAPVYVCRIKDVHIMVDRNGLGAFLETGEEADKGYLQSVLQRG